ncbi:MAG TPA: ThiF family adenylyltransferase [Woeseiaceae bacterium]|nr:ThiF family adenylyltransferase [Woeseiaceae bacterium]
MSTPLRYARHLPLTGFGAEGQRRLATTRVLVIGIGGLGCPVATYLTSAGVGQLVLNDFDTVDETNLARQFLYTADDIGKRKVEIAAARLHIINGAVRHEMVDRRLEGEALAAAVREADVVVDASDNFATRFAVNAACVASRTPLVSGAAIRYEGQLAVFTDYGNQPCYRCIYEEADESLEDCRGNGVFSPVPGFIGTAMAGAVMKLVAGLPVHAGELSLYDAITEEWRRIRLRKRPDCPVCGGR